MHTFTKHIFQPFNWARYLVAPHFLLPGLLPYGMETPQPGFSPDFFTLNNLVFNTILGKCQP